MTAENTEPQNAPGGDDLRARYLPVSRRELRRRREAGILDPRGQESSPEEGTPSAVLSEDGLAELRELHEAVAASDDPHHVDPELLKKQQALADRAMQANQERLAREQGDTGQDMSQRHRDLRPESEVITRKTLRTHMDSESPAEPAEHAPASIEPIQARGAHGLELDAMVEHGTRQGAQQSMMGWLVIILALLLIIAVGVVLSFIL